MDEIEQEILKHVDLLIRSIAIRYRNSVLSYLDYEDLLQEGWAAVFQGLKRWLHGQDNASISSWGYICVVSRYKELATKAAGEAPSQPYDDRACYAIDYHSYTKAENQDDKHDECHEYIHCIAPNTDNNAIKHALAGLRPAGVALVSGKTPQRVVQMQKEFTDDWQRNLSLRKEKKNGSDS